MQNQIDTSSVSTFVWQICRGFAVLGIIKESILLGISIRRKATPHMLTRLVLVDIGGTLLVTGGADRAALKTTLKRVYGDAGRFDDIDVGGRTVLEIVRDLIEVSDLTADEVGERFLTFTVEWAREMRRIINEYNVRICPGAPELVADLAANDEVVLGILTPDLEEIAQIKLVAAGFSLRHFDLGVFGDASDDRANLVPIAVAEAEALTGKHFEPKQVVVIGDSEMNVRTAKAAGARSIAVSSDPDARERLENAGADYVFEDLSGTKRVLRAIFAQVI